MMLDPKLLRKEPEAIAKKLSNRNFRLDTVNLRRREELRRTLQLEVEELQSRKNRLSRDVGSAKKEGADVKTLLEEIGTIDQRLEKIRLELQLVQKRIRDYLISIPNIVCTEVPEGSKDSENVEVHRWGEPKTYNFPVLSHVELGEIHSGLDFSTASNKLSGRGFVVMCGCIASLRRALMRFMLDLHVGKHGYKEYHLPYLVNTEALRNSGHLPRFSEDLFFVRSGGERSEQVLIPTAEVSLVNLVRGEILEEDLLPIRMVAHTPCFRAEAGSYGRKTRGLMRMHQFDKVEMVQVVRQDRSAHDLEVMTSHAEAVLQSLDLPYRKVLLCSGNTGFSSCKTYDLEVWLPSENGYREISSCSNTGDFQSRRMCTRYRDRSDGKLRLAHILNGSGLAVDRTLAAVLENYQLPGYDIEIPRALRKYLGGTICMTIEDGADVRQIAGVNTPAEED